jgi:hypothetical protein
VQRIWRAHGLQPHRVRQFKLSNDPDFVDKLRDVVGLYVDPPAHAIVLSVDEKSQIQALDRTQPGLPLTKGRAGTMTHDYKRNGTTTLFSARSPIRWRSGPSSSLPKMPQPASSSTLRALPISVDGDRAVSIDWRSSSMIIARSGAFAATKPRAGVFTLVSLSATSRAISRPAVAQSPLAAACFAVATSFRRSLHRVVRGGAGSEEHAERRYGRERTDSHQFPSGRECVFGNATAVGSAHGVFSP